MTKWCKGYCMIETTESEYLDVQAKLNRWEKLIEEEQKILDAWKTCNKVWCLNKESAQVLLELAQKLKDTISRQRSENLLKQVERNLY